jgi:hypothetical protein
MIFQVAQAIAFLASDQASFSTGIKSVIVLSFKGTESRDKIQVY